MITEYDTFELVRELYYLHNKENVTRDEVQDLDYRDLQIFLYEHYGFEEEFRYFIRLIDDLLNFTPALQSPLTKTLYHTFGKIVDNGVFCSIVKKEANE